MCGVDRVAGERHLERAFAPDVAGDGDERRVAEQPALAAGDRETGRLGSDREIAGGHQLATCRRGEGVHPGDHRLRQRLDGVHHLGADLEEVAGGVEVGAGHVAEVVSGGEHRAVRGEDHAERVARPDVAQRSGQLDHHVERQRVALLGTVEGDRGDVAVAVDQQMLVRHRLSLASMHVCVTERVGRSTRTATRTWLDGRSNSGSA